MHHSCGGSEEPFLKKALLLYQTHCLLSTPFSNFFLLLLPFSPTSPGVASFPFRFLIPYLVGTSFYELLYIVQAAIECLMTYVNFNVLIFNFSGRYMFSNSLTAQLNSLLPYNQNCAKAFATPWSFKSLCLHPLLFRRIHYKYCCYN